jgi:peptide/nickel transport system ATP-binding protein
MTAPILEVDRLSVGYQTPSRLIRAVDDVSFAVRPGEILGLVGESGSGKSTAILAALRLLPPPGVILAGSVRLAGEPLFSRDAAAMRRVWGAQVGLVPQGALSALNPTATVLEHIAETLAAHGVRPADLRGHATRLLARVGLDPVHLDAYPHALSGGMRQRATMALALALDPPLLVLDEPTTALDVVVEREILRQLLAVQAESGFAMVFVTHDLALLLELATHIGVMYAGRLVEIGPAAGFRDGGYHPYTRGLLAALPPGVGETRRPISIPGHAASVANPPPGCRFHPRCSIATERCRAEAPLARDLATRKGDPQASHTPTDQASQQGSHRVACHGVR